MGPGTVLGGRYTAHRRVEQARGTERWTADDTTLGRPVSVLTIDAEDHRTAALLDAARRAASVSHSVFVRVLDVGVDGEVAYIVEEDLSEARTLADLVAEGGIPADEVRRITGEVAAALESARQRGMHHLDLTPDDVMRTVEGDVRLRGLEVAGVRAGEETTDADDAARRDAVGVVALVYAGLTGLWPLGAGGSGLAPAPRVPGGVAAPSEIAAGVPRDLDALCRLTINDDQGPTSPGDYARQVAPWPSRQVVGRPVTPMGAGRGAARGAPQPASGGKAAAGAAAASGAAVAAGAGSADAPESGRAVAPSGGSSTDDRPGATDSTGSDDGDDAGSEAAVAARGTDPGRGPRPDGSTGSNGAEPHDRSAARRGRAAFAGLVGAGAAAASSVRSRGAAAAAARRAGSTDAAGPGATDRSDTPPGEEDAGDTGTVRTDTASVPSDHSDGPAEDHGPSEDGATPEHRDLVPSGGHTLVRHDDSTGRDGSPTDRAVALASGAGAALAGALTSAGGRVSRFAHRTVDKVSELSPDTERRQPAEGERLDLEAPAPMVPAEPLTKDESKLALGIVSAFLILALVVGIYGVSRIGQGSTNIFGPSGDPVTRTTTIGPSTQASDAEGEDASAAPEPLAVFKVQSYDPQGDMREHDELVGKVYDGDPDTGWYTESYSSSEFGGIKDGVGLVVDLGPNKKPQEIRLDIPNKSALEVYVGPDPQLDGATKIGEKDPAEGEVSFEVPEDVDGQYIILWYTKVYPDSQGGIRGWLNEITVLG